MVPPKGSGRKECFLGLDNIGVFDRSKELPTGGTMEQADGTAWMALYCQCMLEILLILCSQNKKYESMYEQAAFRFVQHFMWISYAMDRIGDNRDEMWDEQDGFFYDLLLLPGGEGIRLKVRSMVGLLSLGASTVFEEKLISRYPKLNIMIAMFRKRHPALFDHIAPSDKGYIGFNNRRLLSILNRKKLEKVLGYMLDEKEFLGPYGIRSLSKYHLEHPFNFSTNNQDYTVQYLPAESDNGMFGGNSNWRGPVRMPVNVLIIRALINFYGFFGDSFRVQCPSGSGNFMTLFEIAREISQRLTSLFLPDSEGKRPVYGNSPKFQDDPNWQVFILFYKYFHGDNGTVLGASHLTGWTSLVATLMDYFGRHTAEDIRRSE